MNEQLRREYTMQATHLIGTGGDGRVYVEVELREKQPARLLPSAFADGFEPYDNPEIGLEAAFTYTADTSCGAAVPTVIRALISNGTPAADWPRERLERLEELADAYHLNGMSAGCVHQKGWTIAPQADTSVHEPRPATDHELGEACETCGYRFGHGWVFHEIPPEPLEEIRALAGAESVEIVTPLQDFTRRHGIDSNAVPVDQDERGGTVYEVTLERDGRTAQISYTMGAALEEEPTAAQVLGSIRSDEQYAEQEPESVDAETRESIEANTARVQRMLGTVELWEELLQTPGD